LTDFDTTLLLLRSRLWHIGKALLLTARAAENGPQTFGSSRNKQDGECWHIAAVTARDMPSESESGESV
jgi:hypothetical protein